MDKSRRRNFDKMIVEYRAGKVFFAVVCTQLKSFQYHLIKSPKKGRIGKDYDGHKFAQSHRSFLKAIEVQICMVMQDV